jgi:hypothetical protein
MLVINIHIWIQDPESTLCVALKENTQGQDRTGQEELWCRAGRRVRLAACMASPAKYTCEMRHEIPFLYGEAMDVQTNSIAQLLIAIVPMA